jgi:hypothetical protein
MPTYDGDVREIIQRHIKERQARMRKKKMALSMLLSIAGIVLAAWASWRAQ